MQGNHAVTRRLASLIAALALTPAAGAQWTLVWSDEFNGTSIDPANWEHQIGTGTAYGLPAGWGNNELEYYTNSPSNSFVSGGNLHIIARRQNLGGAAFTSARLRTKGLQDFLYGKIEARIKLPDAPGVWPAFWMLPSSDVYGGWAASGEIDIIESANTPTSIGGTIHFGGQWPLNTYAGGSYSLGGANFADDFHTFTIEWEPDALRWYVDGVLYYTRTSAQWWSDNAPGNPRAPFDQPFHLLLNVAVGGNYPCPGGGAPCPLDGTGYPAEMLVDWVRVYQTAPPTQDPFLGAPIPIPGIVEAEHYDTGGQGVAYFDFDAANNGGAYRPSEGVDLEICAEGGFNLGWVRQGEWIEYTVDVAEAGEYTLDVRVASNTTGGIFHLEFDGVNESGTLIAPVTGGWQNWTTASATVTLDAGVQTMRFVNTGSATSEYNLNSFTFTAVPTCTGDVNGDGTTNVSDFTILAGNFGASVTPNTSGDLNGDGVVNAADFTILAGAFGCGP
jgi:beta-glucanase (GH16 family)